MSFTGLRVSILRNAVGLAAVMAAALAPSVAAQAISGGAVFPLFSVDEFCESSTFGAYQVGFETPVSGSVDGQIEAYYAPSGSYPWPWAPVGGSGGGAQAPSSYDHDGGFRIAANALIGLSQADRLGLKALVGAGIRRLGAADYSQGGDGDIERYGVESQIAPLVTFGLVADIGLTDRVALRLQGRGNAIFSGELNLKGATSGQDRTLASDTQVFAQTMVGLTIGVGDRR